MNDQQAVARLQRGDIKGLDALMVRYQVKALRTAYLITQDATLAEDVVQDAFVNVYRSIDSFDDQRPFTPWFMRIVVNGAIRTARKGQQLLPLDEDLDLDYLIDPAPGPDDGVESAEVEAAIWAALGALPAERRAVIVLKYYLEMNESEIADQLKIPVGTVKSRLHTAKRQLRTMLQET
ncbi:MAG TPA: RNA polymerase sigma factor [Aggregatilineaceae bacterium]|nr:RNA polymerase sigma factor [Aggregatilineaceae bacterium]